MAVNARNARIYGSDLDAIFLAPLGTALPMSINSVLHGDFVDVGWLGEDGITESLTGSLEKKRGHQGGGVVRTRINEPGTSVSFVTLETTALTVGLRYHDKTVTVASGVRKARRSAGQRVIARAAVIDVFDADDTTKKERYVIERLEIQASGDRVLNNKDIAALQFTGEVIGDYDHLMTVGA